LLPSPSYHLSEHPPGRRAQWELYEDCVTQLPTPLEAAEPDKEGAGGPALAGELEPSPQAAPKAERGATDEKHTEGEEGASHDSATLGAVGRPAQPPRPEEPARRIHQVRPLLGNPSAEGDGAKPAAAEVSTALSNHNSYEAQR
jgi:hypothetical protein